MAQRKGEREPIILLQLNRGANEKEDEIFVTEDFAHNENPKVALSLVGKV